MTWVLSRDQNQDLLQLEHWKPEQAGTNQAFFLHVVWRFIHAISVYELVLASSQHNILRAIETIYMVSWRSKSNVPMSNMETYIVFFDVDLEIMYCQSYGISPVASKW